jgi:hypothetical protein
MECLTTTWYIQTNEVLVAYLLIYFLFFRMRPRGAIWGSADTHVGDFCSNGHGRHTPRTTIALAFWWTSDDVILMMFGTR